MASHSVNLLDLGLITEPDDLEPLLGDPGLLIIDVCQAQTYKQVHIPGAIHLNPAELVCGIPPASGKLPDMEQLKALFSRIGYQADKHIVVYDDEGGGWAGRFIWTLDVIGHRHYSYLNGGIHAWQKEGHPVTREIPEVEASQPQFQIDDAVIADLDEVKNAIGNEQVRIWDARSAEEYAGTRVTARRNGHIPEAVNLDWLQTMDIGRNLRLLPLDELERKLLELGIGKEHRIITHCHTHHRSGLSYLIARALGFLVKAYDGSWSEWGNLPDTPIETS